MFFYKKTFLSVSLIFFLIILTTSAQKKKDNHFLFLNSNVTELKTVNDLFRLIKDGKNLFDNDRQKYPPIAMVMYYSFSCPHCQLMAPLWIRLTQTWQCTPQIQFYAFECSDTTSEFRASSDGITPLEACWRENVAKFPTLHAYWQISQIQHVTGSTSNKSSIKNDNDKEEEEDNLPKPLYNVKLLERKTMKASNVLNAMIKWMRKNTPIKDFVDCPKLKINETMNPLNLISDPKRLHVPHTPRWPSTSFLFHPDIRYHDGLFSLAFLLRNWTPFHEYNKEKLKQLRNVLKISIKLLPGYDVKQSLLQLDNYLLNSIQNTSLWNPHIFHSLLDHMNFNGLTIPPLGSSPKYLDSKHVSSGLWQYFHILSISLLDQHISNRNRSLLLKYESPSRTPVLHRLRPEHNHKNLFLTEILKKIELTPQDVIGGIHDIVESFFACEACRAHFLHAYSRCAADLCTWVQLNNTAQTEKPQPQLTHCNCPKDSYEGLVLWLWRFHNVVTFRTAVEVTSSTLATILEEQAAQKPVEEHTHPIISYADEDVRFPPWESCTECHKKANYTHFQDLDKYKLSPTLVENAVKIILRQRSTDQRIIDEGPTDLDSIDLTVYDRTEDFNIDNIIAFLQRYYWKEEWGVDNGNVRLVWNRASKTFKLF